MKKLNIAKALGITGVCWFIFSVIFCISTDFDDWAGTSLGLSIPFAILYPFSLAKTKIQEQRNKSDFEAKLQAKQEITRIEHVKTSVINIKENHKLLNISDPFQSNVSPDPTLNNK